MPQFRSRPEFFLDRSLAGRVAESLRAASWNVRTHIEVYGGRDEGVEDVEWLELCGREGWIALTKDRRVRYRPFEIAAVRRHRV
jgi:PIN like domain